MRTIKETAIKDKNAFLRPLNLQIFKICTDYIERQKPASILDVGTGIGLLNSILELPGTSRRFGCDVRMDNLSEARNVVRAHGQEAYLTRCWGQELPFKDDSFEAAAILTVFINIDDRDVVMNILREMRRVVKPGGFAVFEYRNKLSFFLRVKHKLNRIKEDLAVTAFSRGEFAEMMAETGWKAELTIPLWKWAGVFTPSFIVIAR